MSLVRPSLVLVFQYVNVSVIADVNALAVEGDDGLLEGRQKIQALGDETRRALKKNVYANYLQFIDAAKEINSKLATDL